MLKLNIEHLCPTKEEYKRMAIGKLKNRERCKKCGKIFGKDRTNHNCNHPRGMLGKKHSEEKKEQISQTLKRKYLSGEKNTKTGIPLSDEHKKHISNGLKKFYKTDEKIKIIKPKRFKWTGKYKKIEHTCINCGNIFKGQITMKYCSQDCFKTYKKANATSMKEIICIFCGKKSFKKIGAKYCSDECRSSHIRIFEKRICLYCKQEIIIKHSEYPCVFKRKKYCSNKCRTAARKGVKLSEKQKAILKLANTGRHPSKETRLKMSLARKGHKLSEETKHKLRNRIFTEEHRRKLRASRVGFRYSEESKKKMSESSKGKITWMKGKHHTEDVRKIIKEKRAKQVVPFKDTKIEVALQNELTNRGIKFEKHKPIMGQPDIFIEPNICVFADGDYWHNRPENIERDKKVNKKLPEEGYVVLRFWEHEIKRNTIECINKVIKIIKENGGEKC